LKKRASNQKNEEAAAKAAADKKATPRKASVPKRKLSRKTSSPKKKVSKKDEEAKSMRENLLKSSGNGFSDNEDNLYGCLRWNRCKGSLD
jgi:hypothetical protein